MCESLCVGSKECGTVTELKDGNGWLREMGENKIVPEAEVLERVGEGVGPDTQLLKVGGLCPPTLYQH